MNGCGGFEDGKGAEGIGGDGCESYTANITITDTEPEPEPELPAVTVTKLDDAAEPNRPGRFEITLDAPAPAGGMNILYQLSGTARAGIDYVTTPPTDAGGRGSVPFVALQERAVLHVQIGPGQDDTIEEGPEDVVLTIRASETYEIANGTATMSIGDDDMAGILATPQSGLMVGEDGTTATFDVVLASQPAQNVNLQVRSSDTSEGTVDRSSLEFTPANWNAPQRVTITGQPDSENDGNVDFTVTLTPESADTNYAALSPVSVMVTNVGGTSGTVQFVMDTYSVTQADGTASIDIERVGGDGGELTVFFVVQPSGSNRAAVEGEDYEQPASNQVTWADGEAGIMTVEVPILDNVDDGEPDENGNIIEDAHLSLRSEAPDGPEQDSAQLLILSEPPSSGPLPPPTGSSPNEASVWNVITETCPLGGNAGGFQELCNGLVISEVEGNDSVTQALGKVTPDDAGTANQSGMSASMVQISAIDGRLGTLRGGGGAGFSASGFSANLGELTLSQGLLRGFMHSFDQNNPAMLQANAATTDDHWMDDFGRLGVWVSGRIVFGEKDPTTNQVDYDFDTAGLTFGMDYRFTENFIGGVAGGYSNTDADIGAGDGTLDTTGYSFALYGTWFRSNSAYFGGSLGYGSNEYSQDRNVRYDLGSNTNPDFAIFEVDQTYSADYDGSQFSASFNAGWEFNKGDWTYGPIFNVSYVDVDVDAYDERLTRSNVDQALGWAVHIDDQNYTSLQPSLGFEFTRVVNTSWGVLIPQGFIEVVSELEDGSQLITGRFRGDTQVQSTFTLRTDDFEETFGRAGLGLGFIFRNNKSAFIMVDGDFGRDVLTTYYVNAGFRWQF